MCALKWSPDTGDYVVITNDSKPANDTVPKVKRAYQRDIAGLKYGHLTAIKYICRIGHTSQWLFKCDCGAECQRHKHNVLYGQTQTCGSCEFANALRRRSKNEAA